MRFLLLFFILLLGGNFATAKLNSSCPLFYGSDLYTSFEPRLKKLFGSEWFRKSESYDAESAKRIVQKLKEIGAAVDLEIFDLYLQILENTDGRYDVRAKNYYYDSLMMQRPRSAFFQEFHWDWTFLAEYFFRSPFSVRISKIEDIKFLKHVLSVAKKSKNNQTLESVLQMAHLDWVRNELYSEPSLRAQLENYQEGKSVHDAYALIKSKVSEWIQQAPSTEARTWRIQESRLALKIMESSNSIFDLMLFEKLFDQIVRLKVDGGRLSYDFIPKWIQMTDPRAIEMGLPYGSLMYMVDFLFQNAHEMASKKHVLKVLNRIESIPLPDDLESNSFYSLFSNAHFKVLRSSKMKSNPFAYKTDLHIYSRNRNPDQAVIDSIENSVVRWDPYYRKLLYLVEDSFPLEQNPNIRVRDVPWLASYVRTYFDNFKRKKTYSDEEIDFDREAELNALLTNSTFFVFTKPGTGHLLSMARLFDGTRDDTYIEKEFPHIEIEEKKRGETVYELGRLLSRPEVEAGSLPTIMSHIAEYLYTSKATGTIYFDAIYSLMKMHTEKFGAEVVFTPEQLNLKKGATRLWVMRISVEKFIKTFYRPTWRALDQRKR